MHEYSEGSSHWGHHEAEHVEDSSAKPGKDHASLDAENRSGAVDVDHHHLPGLYPFPSLFMQLIPVGTASTSPPELSADFATATPSGLERPPKAPAEILRREGLG
jgi:hypothetical protein